jgi:hypothetical protein
MHTLKLTWIEAFPFCFALVTPPVKNQDQVVLFRMFMENNPNHPKKGFWRLQSYISVYHAASRHPIMSYGDQWASQIHDIEELSHSARKTVESWAKKIGIQVEIDSSALDSLADTLKKMHVERVR